MLRRLLPATLLILPVLMVTATTAHAFIPALCDLCAIGVVAGLGITRALGIDDLISAVWIGALTYMIMAAAVALMEKKKIRFPLRDLVVVIVVIFFMVLSLSLFHVIGVPNNTLGLYPSIFADRIVVGSTVGGLTTFGSVELYQYLKRRNGGKPHFPYEKVVLPLASLVIASFAMYILSLYY